MRSFRGSAALLAVLAPAPSVPSTPVSSHARATLASVLRRDVRAAGSQTSAFVADLADDSPVFASRADTRRNPASVEKIYTTSTLLRRLGPDGQLATRALGAAPIDPATGLLDGDLYLVGGGDPTFGSRAFSNRAYGGEGASVEQLARALAQAGLKRVGGAVLGDESLFDSRRGGPRTGFGFDRDIGAPLSALDFDRGLTSTQGTSFATEPAAFAAARLRSALLDAGVAVDGDSGKGKAPDGAQQLAQALSPPVGTLIRLTNQPSDNFFAETLLKDIGARFGGGGSTPAGAAVVREELRSAGIGARLVDGSGLSRADHTSPKEVVRRLEQMRKDPTGLAFYDSLSIAGRNGTLSQRMRGTAAAGRCHAKTGTLSDASALAGYCSVGGHVLAFAFLMNHTNVTTARSVQDRMAVAIARVRG